MADISQVVKVDITRQTGAVTRAGFGIALALSEHYRTTTRYNTYANTDAMLTAGFLATDKAFGAASAYFRATPSPSTIAIGRKQVETVEVTVTDAIDDTDYIISINGTPYTFDSGVAPTTTTIATGLAALVDGDANVSAASAVAVITVTDVLGDWTLSTATSVGGLSEGTITSTETWVDARVAVSTENDAFFMIGITDRTIADQLLIAANTETLEKMFAAAESTTAAVDTAPASDTTSLMAQEKALGHNNTFVLYHSLADGTTTDQWPEFTWMGTLLTVDPDLQTATWNLKSLPGVTVDNLTDTQIQNVVGDQQLGSGGKNGNIYIELGGSGSTQNGKVASSEFIDVMTGVFWLTARLRENIFNALKNSLKRPFTNAGIAVIETEIRKMLQIAIGTDFIAKDLDTWGQFGYQVVVPDISEVPDADKANRILKNVTFDATLAGAIHVVAISGTVSI